MISPKIGIFWVVQGRLIAAAKPANEGEGYGELLTYEPGHLDTWDELQADGTVPRDTEYEEFPRGRVTFNKRTQTFLLLADKCILRDKQMLGQVMTAMNLPVDRTIMDSDSHYRCFRCLGRV